MSESQATAVVLSPHTLKPSHSHTMKHLIIAVTTYLALATQSACGTALAIGDCHLPLMWLPVVLALTWFGNARGIAWSALIGLLADGMSNGRLGQEMLATTLAAGMMLPLRPESRSRTGLPTLVWQFGLIGSGLVLARGYGGLFEGGSPMTFGTLPLLAAEALFGTIAIGVARFGVGRAMFRFTTTDLSLPQRHC